MTALTEAVLAQAIAQCAAWQRSGRALRVSVNLSPRSLLDRELPKRIRSLLELHRADPHTLQLEITESRPVPGGRVARAVLEELRSMGVGVAIDDFGTGFSSLAYLRNFPVDALKIDRSFIDGVGDPDSDDHALVRAIISLGLTFDLRVVAEGIEDEDQRRELVRLGCDRGQGYLFSRPLPASELVLSYGRGPALRYS
jgi:diguanylate cyclase